MTAEENRKKVIKNNLAISLLFFITISGIGGAVYFYNESVKAKASLEQANNEVSRKNDSLKTINRDLDNLRDSLEKQKKILNNQVEALTKPEVSINILTPVLAARDTARNYARIGYQQLKEGNFAAALNSFAKSEKSSPGYRDSYEVYFLLRKNRANLNDPAVQRQILEKIYKDYNSLQIIKKNDIK